MSLGLTVDKGLAIPAPLPATGIPSITINGSLLAVKEAAPRIRIVALPVGSPEAGVTNKPGTLP